MILVIKAAFAEATVNRRLFFPLSREPFHLFPVWLYTRAGSPVCDQSAWTACPVPSLGESPGDQGGGVKALQRAAKRAVSQGRGISYRRKISPPRSLFPFIPVVSASKLQPLLYIETYHGHLHLEGQ